jgi:hypothetical protein
MTDSQDYVAKLRAEAAQTGTTVSKLYADIRKKFYNKKFQKACPTIWKELLSKKYLVPNYRQADYVNQEVYNYFLADFLISFTMEEFLTGNEVLNTSYVGLMRRLECGMPTYFLERELGEALMRTKLPDDYQVSDIKWKFPSIRVYLPKGLLSITRKQSNYMPYLDIVKIEKEQLYDLPWSIRKELAFKLGVQPPYGAKNKYTGMGVSGPLDLEGEFGGVSYAASTGLEDTNIKKVFDVYAKHALQTESPSDDTDQVLIDQILMLGFNILLFLSAYPLEIDADPNTKAAKEEIIRPIHSEGDTLVPGLFKAKFIGQSQLRWKDKQQFEHPTHHLGRSLIPHWRAGHWKRIPYGPKGALRRLGFIETYHVGKAPPNV